MAVTITRTARIDDDGSGSTGTVINNAEKTSLYNEIDGALAKVAQLAGGNTFTGVQSVTDLNTANSLRFLVASGERMRMGPSGDFDINTTTFIGPWGARLNVLVTDAAGGGNGIAIQNSNINATNMYFALFVNGSTAMQGNIIGNGASAVAFNTTSDARLKDDAGRAADLAALRAVVVHDFAWKTDGRTDRGVFAQDAHAVFPRAVTVGTDETTADGSLAHPWMTDYSKFVPDLIVGWQQHDADLAKLRAAFATLAAEKGL